MAQPLMGGCIPCESMTYRAEKHKANKEALDLKCIYDTKTWKVDGIL